MKDAQSEKIDSLLTPIPGDTSSSAIPALQWYAHINPHALSKQLFEHSANGRVRLKLCAEQDYLFSTSYCERVDENCVSWRGLLPTSPDIRACLSVVARPGETTALAGYLFTGSSSLSLETLADGKIRIFTPTTIADTAAQPPCCSGYSHHHVPASAAEYSMPDAAIASQYASLSATPATPAVIRLLAMYPEKTLGTVGGQTQLEAKLLLGASLASEAFANSRINARVEMVFQQENALKGTAKNQGVMGYVEQSLQEPELASRIEAALTTHNADLAVLVTGMSPDGMFGYTPVIPEPPTTVGLALKSRIFAVALKYKIYPDHPGELDLMGERNTLTHELGHALGAKHDRITQPDYSGLDPKYDYVRGYVPDDQSFTTVMGYPRKAWGATRLNYFSGPELSYHGRALGVPTGQPYAADSASFLRLSTQVVSTYKGAKAPHPDLCTLSLTVTPDLAGMLMVDAPGPYRKGSVVKVRAIPRAGSFVFQGWELNGKPVGDGKPAMQVKMDGDQMITARFDAGEARHTLTFSASEPGAVKSVTTSPKPDADAKYADGTTVSVTLQDTNPRYQADHIWALLGWEVDGRYAGNGPELTLRVDGDHTVKAMVGKRKHRLAWRSIPDDARELLYVAGYADVEPVFPVPDTPAHVAEGQPFRFIASGNFDHWRVDGKESGSHFHELNLDCRADTRVEALFKGWDVALKLRLRTNYFDVYPEKNEYKPWVSWAKKPHEINVSSLMALHFDTGREQTYWITPQTPVTLVAFGAKHITLDGKTVTPGDSVRFIMQNATDIYVEYSK